MISFLSDLNKNKHILVTQSLVLKVVLFYFIFLREIKPYRLLSIWQKPSNSQSQIVKFSLLKEINKYYSELEKKKKKRTSFHFLLYLITFPSQYTCPPLQRGVIFNVYSWCYSNKLVTNGHFNICLWLLPDSSYFFGT